jgi:hypothetical protein
MTFNLKMLGAAALVVGGMGLASSANAAPVAPASGLAGSGLVEQVAEGCGPGFFRGRGGYCRPMRGGYGRPVYGPRPGWGPRRCWVRPTPFGPRRVCR